MTRQIMYRKTASVVAPILREAAGLLEGWGRPRKPPGKPRPKSGYEQKGYGSRLWRMSLVGALEEAFELYGANRAMRSHVRWELFAAACKDSHKMGWLAIMREEGYHAGNWVRRYDELELDTRQIVRALKRAAQNVESLYPDMEREEVNP